MEQKQNVYTGAVRRLDFLFFVIFYFLFFMKWQLEKCVGFSQKHVCVICVITFFCSELRS